MGYVPCAKMVPEASQLKCTINVTQPPQCLNLRNSTISAGFEGGGALRSNSTNQSTFSFRITFKLKGIKYLQVLNSTNTWREGDEELSH
jgi:hypothetical protein